SVSARRGRGTRRLRLRQTGIHGSAEPQNHSLRSAEQQTQDTTGAPKPLAPKAVPVGGEALRGTEAKVLELSHTVEILQKASANLSIPGPRVVQQLSIPDSGNIVQQLRDRAAAIGANDNQQQAQKETRRRRPPVANHHAKSGGGETAHVTTPRRQGQQAKNTASASIFEPQTQKQHSLDSPSSGQKSDLLSRKISVKAHEGKILDFQ
ncbi:unnamed protein product, partial [Amoebophrya sp. A120]